MTVPFKTLFALKKWVIEADLLPRLSPPARGVLPFMYCEANPFNRGRIEKSLTDIQQKTGYKEDTILKALRELVELRVLILVEVAVGRQPNVYRFVDPTKQDLKRVLAKPLWKRQSKPWWE